MRFFRFLQSLLPPKEASPTEAPPFDPEDFIYVKLPGDIGPIDRGERFEDKIEPVLAARQLGTVSGGGSQLGDARPDGSRPILFCGIDIDTPARDDARAVLRDLLPTLAAPTGTELHYTKDGRKLQDELSDGGWVLEQARDALHPGLDV